MMFEMEGTKLQMWVGRRTESAGAWFFVSLCRINLLLSA